MSELYHESLELGERRSLYAKLDEEALKQIKDNNVV